MRRLVYILGQPGAGKSTLVRAFLSGYTRASYTYPIAHAVYHAKPPLPEGDRWIELGARRELFSGTDTLSMAVLPGAVRWLNQMPSPMQVIAEGDRLATQKFFAPLRTAGWVVELVWLDTPDDVAAQRRALRGTAQDSKWIASRVTKVQRLVDAEEPVDRLDGMLSPDDNARRLRQLLADTR